MKDVKMFKKNLRRFVQRQLAVPRSSVVQVAGASPIDGDVTETMIVETCQMKLDVVSGFQLLVQSKFSVSLHISRCGTDKDVVHEKFWRK